jgi:hypothetical protein
MDGSVITLSEMCSCLLKIDGLIIAAIVNAPESYHDSTLAEREVFMISSVKFTIGLVGSAVLTRPFHWQTIHL